MVFSPCSNQGVWICLLDAIRVTVNQFSIINIPQQANLECSFSLSNKLTINRSEQINNLKEGVQMLRYFIIGIGKHIDLLKHSYSSFNIEKQILFEYLRVIQIHLIYHTNKLSIQSNQHFQLSMTKSNSELISWFQKVKQGMQLEEDKEKIKSLETRLAKRRQKLTEKFKIEDAAPSKSMNKSISEAEKFKSIDDHRIPLDQFCRRYGTDLKKGLSESVAAERLLKEGENRLTQKEGLNPCVEYLMHMANFFGCLLWAGALLCFIAFGVDSSDPGNLYLGIVLVAIVNISTFVEFWQNRKSKALMESFKNFIPPQITVVRDGIQKSISSVKLVRGDLIKVQLGKKIPADIRIVESNGMKVDNSSLTGQTQLLSRTIECTNPDNPLQTRNIAFFSTLNREGSGKGVVIFTGDNTFIGQIAGLALSAEEEQTPLNKEINRFIRRLGVAAVCLGIIVLSVGLAIGFQVINALTLAIGITVANVPNGLLLQVTISLTLTAKRLAKKKVLAKNLQAVQTLGCTTCICSDKTGTLTMNKMIAANLMYSGKIFKAANRQKEGPTYSYEYSLTDPGFKALHECAVVCSVAIFDKSPPETEQQRITEDKHLNPEEKRLKLEQFLRDWQEKIEHMPWLDVPTIGDASESALIKFFQPIEDIVATRGRYPIIKNREQRDMRLLFSSVNKFAFSINRYPTENSDLCLFTKGAPERVWKMCTHILVDGVPVPKDQHWEKVFTESNDFFGNRGQRVLGFAMLHLPKDKYRQDYDFNIDEVANPNFPLHQQTFVGILSLNDPPRQSVPFAVIKCHTAGVKVIMVTGDQPVTAAAIARECNIISEELTINQIMKKQGKTFDEAYNQSQAIVVHGDQITKMTLQDEGLPQAQQGKLMEKWLHKKQIVFARTSPAQKLIIVKACQKLGEIVAVTGDGVNDSPAIKKADLGISMGITGTDVAKDAASMVLLNDDFSSIIVGIEEGRKIFDNLKKAIMYIASSQTTEIIPFIVLLIFQIPPPISTVLVLCIDLGTDLIPAISFAYQDTQIGIMTRKPRSKEDHLVTVKLFVQGYGFKGFINYFACQLSWFIVMNDFGFPPFQLLYTNGIKIYLHADSDIYNPTSPFFGNSLLAAKGYTSCSQFNNDAVLIDWLYARQASTDLRMSALNCHEGTAITFTPIYDYTSCRVQQISPISNRPVCFTSQAVKYAQSSYFYTNFVGQMFNNIVTKTRRESVFTQGMHNTKAYFALTTEIIIGMILAYTKSINIVFGSRDNTFEHYGMVAVPFSIVIFAIEEIRRFLIRSLPPDEKGRPNWFERCTLW